MLAITQSGETPSDEEASDGLTALNQMLHAWEHDGIDLSHVDLSLTDTVALPDSQLQAVAYNLAVYAAPEYGVTPSPVVVAIADKGYANLQNYYQDIPELTFDKSLDPYYKPNRYY